jgi:two-component system, chemotaxis family, CheB/CheR fusion protein
VLVLAPTGRDAELAIRVLAQAGLRARPYRDAMELCRVAATGAGALLLTDEALDERATQCLLELLDQQPPWSDLPLLLLVSSEASAESLLHNFGLHANVTILERPIHLSTFSSAALAAVSARRRQYQIRHLLRELEKADRLKDEFLATLSHELRNPLNSIIGNAAILLRSSQTEHSSFVQRAAETIHRNASAQARLINDLLDLSRLQTGKLALDRQVIALAPVLADAVESVRETARARQITLEVRLSQEPLLVAADAVRLEQIVWNLLNNALKFTPDGGGKVTLSLEREQNQAKLVVEDNGQGIERDFLPHIFEMFSQEDARTTKLHGGMGIGLALVRQLAELHGGRVEAESAGVGQGARFTVWLPLYQAKPKTDRAVASGGNVGLAGLHILVVDDTPDSVEMMRVLLEMEGARVTTATSGTEALRQAAAADFDLIISDISMPGMDGYELMDRLRREARTANVPAIALTGFGRPEDAERARRAGFTTHLTKPLNFDYLVNLACVTLQNNLSPRQ